MFLLKLAIPVIKFLLLVYIAIKVHDISAKLDERP